MSFPYVTDQVRNTHGQAITNSMIVFAFLCRRKAKECALCGKKEAETEQKTEYDTMY